MPMLLSGTEEILLNSLFLTKVSLSTPTKTKETVIWHEFKERLATSNFIAFTIDPSVFIQRFKNMDFLEDPFMPQEIDDIVKSLPNDKSPGPNGFNNEFLKSCWQIIKADFYNLCNAFHQGSLCLKSIKKPSLLSFQKWMGQQLFMTSGLSLCLTPQLNSSPNSWLIDYNLLSPS